MPKAKRKVSAREIMTDIRRGMTEAQLKEKYALSARDLRVVKQKLADAGHLKQPVREGPIPEDHALIPVEKKARDVPREYGAIERQRRLRAQRREQREREQSERLLKIMDSTVHWWLTAIGLCMLAVGCVLYLAWPLIEGLWMEDLALSETLNYHGPAQRTYELWRSLSQEEGPILAALGALIGGAGVLQWRLNTRKIKALMNRQRQGLAFNPSRED